MADTPTFMGIPIVVDEGDEGPTDVKVTNRRPIRVIKGRVPEPQPAAGWLFDDKGRVRVGPCGHPLRPAEYDDIIGNPCRVCWLTKGEDAGRISAYYREADTEGRRRLARARWGSTPKKMRSANSYKPGPTPCKGHGGEVPSLRHAVSRMANDIDDVIAVNAALARVCPESSRTIRFRHGDTKNDPIRIGEPLTYPQDINHLHDLVAGWGASIVHQQAALSQSLIDESLINDPVMQTIDQAGAALGASLARTFTGDDD